MRRCECGWSNCSLAPFLFITVSVTVDHCSLRTVSVSGTFYYCSLRTVSETHLIPLHFCGCNSSPINNLCKMEFKELIVYQKALEAYSRLETSVLSIKELDRNLKDQLKRASISIVLNIAEGSSRFSYADRKNYLVISTRIFIWVRCHTRHYWLFNETKFFSNWKPPRGDFKNTL